MPVVMPRVFVSYSRKDSDVLKSISDSLQRAGIQCWLDTLRLQVGDEWSREIEEEIAQSDAFLAYITPNYLGSTECTKELDFALSAQRLLILPYADAKSTLDRIPEHVRSRINCGVLDDPGGESFQSSLLELAGRAWVSLQVSRRMVPSRNHILASASIFDSPGFTREDILKRTTSELVLAGSNLRSWLSDPESIEGLVSLVKERKLRLRLIMATRESLRGVSEEGALHLDQSVLDVEGMLSKFDPGDRRRFSIHFHIGASTLSAVFIDPMLRTGILFFSPRWAIQFLPQDRFSCVIDKSVNGDELYKSLYNSVLLMTQRDAKSIDDMLAKLPSRVG